MARGMTHDEIRELLGVYALDAAERDEAEQVEAHLALCPGCAWEVASHREVAAALAQAGSPAPEGVWDRIAGSLEEQPPALDLSKVAPLPKPPAPPRRRVSGSMAVLVATAALVSAVLGVVVVRQEQRLDRVTRVTRQRALEQAASSASADARARRVTLRSEDGYTYAEAVVQQNGDGYLVRHNLPPLAPGRTYQLWGRIGTRSVSLGVWGPTPGVVAFNVSGDVTGVAVTEEEDGGSVLPAGRPVVRGFMPDS